MRNRVGLPNRGSARNRTYPGRTSPSDSGCKDQKRAKARLWRRQSTQQKVEAIRSTRTDAQGRTNVSLARREAEPQLAGERQRGVVVTFGWQPCSKADRRSTLRRFRIRGTSHQPMSSERAGKSVRAERKRVARLAVWCVEGRNEPVERSIMKTLVLARVARSVVAGYGFGRKHGRGSPNDRSVSNGWQVVMRESEVLP